MRKLMIVVFIALIAVWGCSPAAPKTEDQKAFYALGVHLNKQLSVFDLTPEEMKFVQQGMSDAATGKKLAAEPEANMKKLGELAQARMLKATEKQKALAKPFLENAAKEKGAVKTASGLIYKEIKAGTGAQPKPTDIVKVHYVGTLIDGKEFDSSIKRGQPAELPLNQVFPCWTEGIPMMKVGGKAKLVCPSETAYGDNGRPPVIPGGATLIFEVELLDTKAAGEAPAMPAMPPAPAPKPNVKK
jgi:FKBP-type peptidyl-prolyl cis-trans isomerase FkpA